MKNSGPVIVGVALAAMLAAAFFLGAISSDLRRIEQAINRLSGAVLRLADKGA